MSIQSLGVFWGFWSIWFNFEEFNFWWGFFTIEFWDAGIKRNGLSWIIANRFIVYTYSLFMIDFLEMWSYCQYVIIGRGIFIQHCKSWFIVLSIGVKLMLNHSDSLAPKLINIVCDVASTWRDRWILGSSIPFTEGWMIYSRRWSNCDLGECLTNLDCLLFRIFTAMPIYAWGSQIMGQAENG